MVATNNSKLLIGPAIISIFVFLLFFSILYYLDFFTFDGTESSAKIVASALSLVGALIGSLLTFVGLFMKHSIDQRNLVLLEQAESRFKIESERNANLAKEAERRLNIETAIQAIGLLSANGVEVPNTQRAGVVLTLANLGLVTLSLSLINQMLQDSKIDSGTASWVFNIALDEDNATPGKDKIDIQREASLLLDAHIDKMLEPKGQANCPPILLSTKFFDLPDEIQLNGIFCLVDLILLRPYSEWDPGTFFTIINSIHQIWKKTNNSNVQAISKIALSRFLKAYDANTYLNLDTENQLLTEILKDFTEIADSDMWGTHPNGTPRSQTLHDWFENSKHKSWQ